MFCVCVCDLFAFIYTGKNIFSQKVEKEKLDSRKIMNSNHSSRYLEHCFPLDSVVLFYSIYSSFFYLLFQLFFLGCFNHNSFVEFHFDSSFSFNIFSLFCIFSTWLFEWKTISHISFWVPLHFFFTWTNIFAFKGNRIYCCALFTAWHSSFVFLCMSKILFREMLTVLYFLIEPNL